MLADKALFSLPALCMSTSYTLHIPSYHSTLLRWEGAGLACCLTLDDGDIDGAEMRFSVVQPCKQAKSIHSSGLLVTTRSSG